MVTDRKNPAVVQQSQPLGDGEVVVYKVLKDLKGRARFGKRKYGTFLRANNGRDALLDAYQEALDLCMYLAQAIIERRI